MTSRQRLPLMRIQNDRFLLRVLIPPSLCKQKTFVCFQKVCVYHLGCWNVGRTVEEFVNHTPAARDLQIFLVFYRHPAW